MTRGASFSAAVRDDSTAVWPMTRLREQRAAKSPHRPLRRKGGRYLRAAPGAHAERVEWASAGAVAGVTPHSSDWTPDQVKAAVHAAGLSLKRISVEAGYYDSGAWQALYRFRWPKLKRVIAARLGRPPQEIWPSIFDAEGNVRPNVDRRRRPHAERLKPAATRKAAS